MMHTAIIKQTIESQYKAIQHFSDSLLRLAGDLSQEDIDLVRDMHDLRDMAIEEIDTLGTR